MPFDPCESVIFVGILKIDWTTTKKIIPFFPSHILTFFAAICVGRNGGFSSWNAGKMGRFGDIVPGDIVPRNDIVEANQQRRAFLLAIAGEMSAEAGLEVGQIEVRER